MEDYRNNRDNEKVPNKNKGAQVPQRTPLQGDSERDKIRCIACGDEGTMWDGHPCFCQIGK